MEFQEIVTKAKEVSLLYDQLNEAQGHKKWGTAHFVQGLVEDIGSLTRLVQMKEGVRESFEDLDEKLKHEICDCLWAVIRIAQSIDIDLEKEFPIQMDKLAQRVKEEKR